MRRVTDWSLMETQISPFQTRASYPMAVKRFMSRSGPGRASGTLTAKNAEQLLSYQISEVICETGSNEMLQNDIGNILTLRCMWSTCGLCELITQIIISCSLIKDTHTAHKEAFLANVGDQWEFEKEVSPYMAHIVPGYQKYKGWTKIWKHSQSQCRMQAREPCRKLFGNILVKIFCMQPRLCI